VSCGAVTAVQAWPSFFGVPGEEAPPAGLTLEKATPESFAADMAALVRNSSQVTLREPPAPAVAQAPPGHSYVPDPEWT
jgi:hypothetical protein